MCIKELKFYSGNRNLMIESVKCNNNDIGSFKVLLVNEAHFYVKDKETWFEKKNSLIRFELLILFNFTINNNLEKEFEKSNYRWTSQHFIKLIRRTTNSNDLQTTPFLRKFAKIYSKFLHQRASCCWSWYS